ncbi:MAG TPA: HAMP domain-containing sensor histidine kinase, partial [Albitalea sp.]
NQMLALARADSVELEPEAVDAGALAEAVTRQWWSQAREQGIDLGFEPPAEKLQVSAQAGLLNEALGNLLHNAIRYTPRGGQVTVRVARSGDAVEIVVIDDGPGMPPPDRARAGERFFRGSNVTLPGSGLGLAIVRSIAQRHGGELRIDGGPNDRGLSVSMRLPLLT